MHIETTHIPDVKIITPKQFNDDRGFFMETFRQDLFEHAIGRSIKFKQSNHSYSRKAYTLRGLHFQSPPHVQEKLVRCTRGKILDVAVDIRRGSPSFGRYVKAELSADNGQQLFVPAGFLHGFLTLSDDTEVQYQCTDYYAPKCNGFVLWNDKTLAIDWGTEPQNITLSEQDQKAISFDNFKNPF